MLLRIMSKRGRDDQIKRPVPSMSGFDSPPRTRRAVPKAPDQRERYLNRRVPRDPELLETKELWMAPELVFKKYGIRGILRVLEFETYDTKPDGQYSKDDVAGLQKVMMRLSQLIFQTPAELLTVLGGITSDVSELVRKNVMELGAEFAQIASETELRF